MPTKKGPSKAVLISPPEMQKVSDAADISLLFFSAGANFGPFRQFWVIFGQFWQFWANLGNFG